MTHKIILCGSEENTEIIVNLTSAENELIEKICRLSQTEAPIFGPTMEVVSFDRPKYGPCPCCKYQKNGTLDAWEHADDCPHYAPF